MSNTLLVQGLQLMLAGMATVFVFLSLLVFATTLLSRLVRPWETTPIASGAVASTATIDAPSAQELAAITAAVHRHRAHQAAASSQLPPQPKTS